MSLLDFRSIFGSASAWVAGALLLALGVLVVTAVVQNRDFTFWQLKIGTRKERTGASVASARQSRERGYGSGAGDVQPYDELFDVDRCAAFFERIAPVYDSRNSEDLGTTHLATIARIQERLALTPELRVLDLGGGTGNPIATHFFDHEAVEWTHVDVCAVLSRQFRQTLESHPLGRRMIVETGDLNVVVRGLPPARYDLVLLSLVLTSMPTMPNFADIARLLAPRGMLVISDIGPGYTRLKPYYQVRVDGEMLALRTVAVDPLDVARRATAAGLVTTELVALGRADPYYSFIATFVLP